MVRPVNISAIAEAFLLGATRPVATTEPTPKKVPWAKAVMMRRAHQRPVVRRQRTGEIAKR